MKIFISASMTFTKEILETRRKLEELGHEVVIPFETKELAQAPNTIESFKVDLAKGKETNILYRNFQEIEKVDVLLTLNFDKRGIKGYIGPSALMEMGLAFYLGHKLFLFQDVPHWEKVSWGYEVRLMQPIIINGDVTKIS